MKPLIAADLDGTLINYMGNDHPSTPARVNPAMVELLAGKRVIVCTNQGGLALGEMGLTRKDGRPYPTVADFLARLEVAKSAYDISCVFVALYQPKAPDFSLGVYDRLMKFYPFLRPNELEPYKKPYSGMLISAQRLGATIFYGDDKESDGVAASGTYMPFVLVERYV